MREIVPQYPIAEVPHALPDQSNRRTKRERKGHKNKYGFIKKKRIL